MKLRAPDLPLPDQEIEHGAEGFRRCVEAVLQRPHIDMCVFLYIVTQFAQHGDYPTWICRAILLERM